MFPLNPGYIGDSFLIIVSNHITLSEFGKGYFSLLKISDTW